MVRTNRVGFLVKTYPKVSETFILNEILELEKQGMPLHIFSLYPPTDESFHSKFEKVRASVTYLSSSRDHRIEDCPVNFEKTGTSLDKAKNKLNLLRNSGLEVGEDSLSRIAALALKVKVLGIRHLHVHFASEPSAVAELVHDLIGISFSISAHAKDIYLSDDNVLRRRIDKASFLVTCTEYNCRYLKSLCKDSAPIHRVYHGLDMNQFKVIKQKENSSNSGIHHILSVGRLREKKGFRYLIEACGLLKRNGFQFICEIIGYGPQQKELESLICQHGLQGSVLFGGKLTHDALIDKYKTATVFVLPCVVGEDGDRDGIPNVLLEAMAMEVPVVSTNISGIPEVVHPMENGLLVEPGNSEALMKTIALVLNQPQLRKDLGQNGRKFVSKNFSSESNIKPLQKLLTKALGSSSEEQSSETVSASGNSIRTF